MIMNACMTAHPLYKVHFSTMKEAALATGAEDMDEDDEEGTSAEHRAGRSDDAGARPPIYNAEGLHEKLEDISWPTEVFGCLRLHAHSGSRYNHKLKLLE